MCKKVPPNKEHATLVFTKRETATLAECIEIFNWYYANGKNQLKTVKHFSTIYSNLMIKQPLVSAWVKEEAKWQEEWAQSNGRKHMVKRVCQTQYPYITEMLDLWVSKAMGDNILITGEVLHQKWKKFANLAVVPEDK